MRRASTWFRWCGVPGILALAIVTGGAVADAPQASGAKTQTMKHIAKRIGLVLPETMHVTGVQDEAGIDQMVLIKLATHASGLQQFLAANHLDKAGFEDIQRGLLLPDAGWWDPSKAASLPTLQIRRPGAATLNIGYALKPDSTVDLYIMWFTT